MKVSVVQMNMRSLAGKENFDRAEALIRRAARETAPDVILLPETWNTGFMPRGRPCRGERRGRKGRPRALFPACARAERQHRRGERIEQPRRAHLQYRLCL